MTHLHCPGCGHCAEFHRLAPLTPSIFRNPEDPGIPVLQCAGCEGHICPADDQDRQDILRFMFITSMIEHIETVGI